MPAAPLPPLQKAHEYTRALNAAKLERIFAKPFITALTHSDGITCLARNPKSLNSLLSGTADGGIRIWDIPAKRTLRRLEGHTGAVKGISFAPDGETCVSCSTDCTVSSWGAHVGWAHSAAAVGFVLLLMDLRVVWMQAYDAVGFVALQQSNSSTVTDLV
jgi:hypothetical protein